MRFYWVFVFCGGFNEFERNLLTGAGVVTGGAILIDFPSGCGGFNACLVKTPVKQGDLEAPPVKTPAPVSIFCSKTLKPPHLSANVAQIMESPGEPRRAQESSGEPRRAQESPGEPRRTQDSPGEPRRAQESPGEHRRA